jgi:hypothetical protein
MASINGGYMFVSGLVTYLLAQETDPVRVAGYASLTWMPVLLKLVDTITVEKFLGMDTGIWAIVVTTVMIVIAVGALHY